MKLQLQATTHIMPCYWPFTRHIAGDLCHVGSEHLVPRDHDYAGLCFYHVWHSPQDVSAESVKILSYFSQ